jgi:hypothetical protein
MTALVRQVIRGSIALVVISGFGVRPAAAQNLLTNPHFDSDVSAWTFGAVVAFDAAHDANGSGTSGSALQSVTLPTFLQALTQCVDGITPGTTYQFGGQIRPTLIAAGGSAVVGVAFFPNAGCSGPGLTSQAGTTVSALGSFQSSTGSIVAPAGASSVQVIGTFSGSGNFQADFDEMFFQAAAGVPTFPATSTRVFLLGALLMGGIVAGTRRLASRR